ncbi:MAG TPA: polymer-forming cytoskeletal protein [Reyranellaceae bacterium]|nr:polymer-forming cytoskeletal protein [Reyranellaceae bacterium]
MFGKKPEAREATASVPKVPTIISADMTIRGDLIGAGDLQIEGNVHGRIDVDHLVIAAGGSVEGDVVAKKVRISGALDGSLSADQVTLAATCNVRGDIEYETLVMEAGARLEGQCRRLAAGTRDAKLLSGDTASAVESTLSHLNSVPRRVA